MSANPSMERMQIIVSREQKSRMKALAKASNTSVSEMFRRAADAYTVSGDDEEIDHPELEALVEALEASTRDAEKALDRAEREVRATLDFYGERARARRQREERAK